MPYIAAASAVVGFFGSKGKEKKEKKQTEDDRKFQREAWLRERRAKLEDRKYKEDAVGSYGQFNKDTSIQRPAGTNIEQELMANESTLMSPWAKPKK